MMVYPLKQQPRKQMKVLKGWPADHPKDVGTMGRNYWGSKMKVYKVPTMIDA